MNRIKQSMDVIDFITNVSDKTANDLGRLMGNTMKDLEKLTIKAPSGFNTSIEINGYEYDAIVDYEFTPTCYGARKGGVQIEPDDEAYVEIGKIWIKDGEWKEIEIPGEASEHYEDEILEYHAS